MTIKLNLIDDPNRISNTENNVRLNYSEYIESKGSMIKLRYAWVHLHSDLLQAVVACEDENLEDELKTDCQKETNQHGQKESHRSAPERIA